MIEQLQEEIRLLRIDNARLQISSDILAALEAAGVDNWEGYEAAGKIYDENKVPRTTCGEVK